MAAGRAGFQRWLRDLLSDLEFAAFLAEILINGHVRNLFSLDSAKIMPLLKIVNIGPFYG